MKSRPYKDGLEIRVTMTGKFSNRISAHSSAHYSRYAETFGIKYVTGLEEFGTQFSNSESTYEYYIRSK